MKILVTGASGLVGRRLISHLEAAGHQVLRVTRRMDSEDDSRAISVDLTKGAIKDEKLRDVNAVINLMGESIFGLRWTEEKKRKIYESRVLGTRNLIESLKASGALPSVFISASAVGYYGNAGSQVLDENSSQGTDFLAKVCGDWEAEARHAEKIFPGLRLVLARLGVVLSDKGGMLEKIRRPTALSLGAIMGSGQQWMSWIHEEDLTEALITALTSQELSGPVNLVSPEPVTNKDFYKVFADSIDANVYISVPESLLRLGIGEMADLLLFSQRATPGKLTRAKFEFKHPGLREALKSLDGHH